MAETILEDAMVNPTRRLVGVVAFLASLGAVSTAGVAGAAYGPYVSLSAGGINVEDSEADGVGIDYDTGVALGGQLGYQFRGFRLEGELGFQFTEGLSENDVNSDVDISRFTVNGYVDLPLGGQVTPYIGGGFGVAGLHADGDFEDDDTAFTWHGEVGLGLGLTDRFTVAPSYRYQWIDSDLGGQSEPLISHIFGISLRYQFFAGPRPAARGAVGYPGNRYQSGYGAYRYDPYDRYDDDERYHHHRHDDRDREKTPAERERDRCGWKGPGCEDQDSEDWESY